MMFFHAAILLAAQDKAGDKDWLHTEESRLGSWIYTLTLTLLCLDFLVEESEEG